MANKTLLRFVSPFQRFAQSESFSGILLIFCTVVALVWANSPFRESYAHFWHLNIGVTIGPFSIEHSLAHWINDGLMAIFFFVIGLEIKREVLVGELASPSQALFPIVAAIGGMIFPALIYTYFNAGTNAISGWGVPMATDIAFALGVLSLLGDRIPVSLKVFLAAAAIVDDLGAVLVIAFFYTDHISLVSLFIGALIVVASILCNRFGVRKTSVYFVLGLFLWLAFLKSGVHATLAGVILAMTIPARTKIDEDEFVQRGKSLLEKFQAASKEENRVLGNRDQFYALDSLQTNCENADAPLQRLEHGLHGLVSFLIMPLFAMANAGVYLGGDLTNAYTNPVTLGVLLGLIIGKQLGITLLLFVLDKVGIISKPYSISWRNLIGVGWLAGIGFTMSLFIANLAFKSPEHIFDAKVGILSASLIAGIIGYFFLKLFGTKQVD